jgi:hypothetical protein
MEQGLESGLSMEAESDRMILSHCNPNYDERYSATIR